MASYRSTSPQPADVVTYRLGESLVYVKPALDYQEALDIAQKEFAEVLGDVARSQITFTIQATMNGVKRTVRISESAWASTVSRLLRGEVIDLEVLDDKRTTEPPPRYLEVPDSKEAGEDTRRSRSSPSSRASSRQPSPSGRSEKGSSRWFVRF